MPFKIVRNDLTKVRADAIVNTANPKPVIGGGTDTAVYEAAGTEQLLEERKKIGEIEPGQAAVTPAFALRAKIIIHTVGPVWIDGAHNEEETLASCYRESLKKAEEHACESVAFPLIATGTYGYPKDRALQTAISVISEWLLTHEMTVILVVFDETSFVLSGKVFQDVDAFIDENYVAKKRRDEYRPGRDRRGYAGLYHFNNRRARRERPDLFEASGEAATEEEGAAVSAPMAPPVQMAQEVPGGSLEDKLKGVGETFQQRLLHLIDDRGLSDVEVYKKANIDRKLFSKIRCRADYVPGKKTALALAISMKLDMEETKDLLARAGHALSPSSQADLIITWFIENGKYDINEVNLALFDHKQPILGA